MQAVLDPTLTGPIAITGQIEPISGAVPMMPVTNAGNGRRQVTIEEYRLAGHRGDARVPVGRVCTVEALLLTAEPARLRARAVVTSPSDETTVIDLVPIDAHRFRAPFVPAELGAHRVRIEGWVDHPAMWLDQALARVADGTAGGLTLQRGSAILFGASLRAVHGDREALAMASKLLDGADHPALLQSEQVLRAVDVAGRHPDIDTVTVETTWHEVLVQPAHAAAGAWCAVTLPPGDVAAAMGVLDAALERAAQLGFDVLCVDLTGGGRDDQGLAGPAPAAADAWRDLAGRARSRGLHLGVRLGMGCEPDHPWRRDSPWWFKQDPDTGATSELDIETQDWGALWHAIESLWQQWLDVGVDAFAVHRPQHAPIRFWDWLVPTLRRRELNLVVASTGLDDPLVARRFGASGFDLVFLDSVPATWAHAVDGADGFDVVPADDPAQARVGRWVADESPADAPGDWLRAVAFAGCSGWSYAVTFPLEELLEGPGGDLDVLVHLHAWRHGSAGPLSRVTPPDDTDVVVLAAHDATERGVIVAAGADGERTRRRVAELVARSAGPDHGWLDVLEGVVVDRAHLVPDALPARLLVPLPPA